MKKSTSGLSHTNDKQSRLDKEAKNRQLATGYNQHADAEETSLTASAKRSVSQSEHDTADAAKTPLRKTPFPKASTVEI